MPENFQYDGTTPPPLDLSLDLNASPIDTQTFSDENLDILKKNMEVPSQTTNAWNNIKSISKQISPFYGNPAGITTPVETPLSDAKKYLDMGYGYIQGIDNDDFYSDTQGVLKTLGKGALKFPALITTKLGQNIGYLGALANPFNWGDNVVANAADNGFSKFFAGVEDTVKNDWFRTFNSAEDREKGFFGRMFTDLDFWTDDFVDGAAFMGSAWVPGFALYKMKGGQRIMGALGKVMGKTIKAPGALAEMESVAAGTNYFTNAQRAARNIDKYTGWAMATAGESLFEASEIKKNVYESLGVDKFGNLAINPSTGQPYTEDEKNKIAANAAQSGFLMNAALLSVTNLFELPYVTKIFGGGKTGMGAITGATKIGEELAVDAGKNAWQKFMRSNYGALTKGVAAGILREGLVEENAQLAIQRFNEMYGSNGILSDMFDYKTYAGLGNQLVSQTANAMKGEDPEASMNIGLGGLLGGGMSSVVDFKQAKKEKLRTEEIVKAFNVSQSDWLKFGDIFKKEEYDAVDDNGNAIKKTRTIFDANNEPIVDDEKIGSILSNAKSYAENLGLATDDDVKSPLLKNILKDMSFAKFVKAHIKAENEEGLIQKLDNLKTSSPEDLAKLGFVKDAEFENQIEKYKGLASRIINQNKRIDDDIRFDNTEDDEARRNMLLNFGSDQAVYKSIADEEQRRYQDLKNELINSNITSLSDGLVDQLNQIQYRINSQKQLIEALGNKKTLVDIHKKVLGNLEQTQKKLLTDNETSVKELVKNEAGFYEYEKEGRNDFTVAAPINKKLKVIGELQNHIDNIGAQWGHIADFKSGKQNFTSLFKEVIEDPLNEKIEQDNKAVEEEDNLVDTVNIEDMEEPGTTPISALQPVTTPTSVVTPGVPSLENYLKEKYDLLKQNGQVTVPYENWKQSGAANTFIKLYNEKYKKSEKPIVPTKTGTSEEEIPSDLLEDQEDELPDEFRDVLTADEDEDLIDELGVQSLSSLKLGPYVINTGDKINDEEIKLITDKTVVVGDNIMSYDEVRKALDAFRGRNITRKGETSTSETEVPENGEIIDVQETQVSTLNQKIQDAIDKANSNVVFGGSAKVIQGGSKINNRSDNYIVEVYTKPGGGKRIDRQRTSPNPNYPMVMSTPDINKGTPIKLIADTEIKDFREEDSLDPSKIKVRKASDFFDGSKVKTSALNNFPIRIDAEIDGKTVSLGYLPTMDWLEARWPDGETMNVVEFITLPSGEKINNLEIQKTKLTNLRKQVLEGQNKNSKFILESVVSDKSDGLLRTSNTLKKLSKIVKPDTKLGIIRNGLIHLENDEVLDSSDVIANFDSFSGKEGWPVVLLSTPTGNTFASFLSVPKLAPEHQDFIVTAWNAFHVVKDAKDLSTVKPFVNIVKAVYDVMETPYQEGVVVDFNVLKSYVNNYITFTSGRQYNPLAKEGTSQLNITEDGKLTVWSVKEKTKDKDVFIANNPTEFVKKEAGFREKLSELYYNVKTTTEFSQGINSTKTMKFLSSVGGSVKITSSPMTYNDYMMNILETNIEPGRPVDASDPNSELVYFANPVLTFDQVKSNEAELQAEEKKATTSTSAGPIAAPTTAVSIVDKFKEKYNGRYANRMQVKEKDGSNRDLQPDEIEVIEDLIKEAKDKNWDVYKLYVQLNNLGFVYSMDNGAMALQKYLGDRLSGEVNVPVSSDYNFYKNLEAPVSDIKVKKEAIAKGINNSGEDKIDFTEEQLIKAVEGIKPDGKISTSALQRIFKIGNNKATRIAEKIDAELAAQQGTPTQTAAPVSDIEAKKATVKGRIASQGTTIELEVIGESGKEFLLFIDRNNKGRVELYSEKKDWEDGTFTYRPGEGDQASQEQVNKLYNKYISESVRNLITEWQNSFVGSWAAPETEDGKNHKAIEKRLEKELASLEGKSVSGSNYKDLKVGQVLNITSKADPSVTGIFTVSEIEKPDFIRFDMDISDGTKETGIGYSEKEFNELFEVKKSVKPTEGLAGLAAQAAPETGELLDLDLDLGDIAEDIGKPDDTGLKSIRTSLKELKKTCD